MNNDLERLPGFDDWPYDLSLLGFEEELGDDESDLFVTLTLGSQSLNKTWVHKSDGFFCPRKLTKRLNIFTVSGNTLAVGVYRKPHSVYMSPHGLSSDSDSHHYKIVLAKHTIDILAREESLNAVRAWLHHDNEVSHGN